VGIFNRKNAPTNQGQLEEERYKLLGREIQTAVATEFESLAEMMNRDRTDPESVEYEKRELLILSTINSFLNEILGSGFDEQKLPLDWERIKDLVKSPEIRADPRNESLIAELIEVSIYYLDTVKSGNFVMIPNANLAKSKRYRSYLLGNNLNGDLNWGWNNDPITPREAIDRVVTQIVAKAVTEILDKVGAGMTHNIACAFAVAVCLSWEKSEFRFDFK
jgi:hypothetical protein